MVNEHLIPAPVASRNYSVRGVSFFIFVNCLLFNLASAVGDTNKQKITLKMSEYCNRGFLRVLLGHRRHGSILSDDFKADDG